MATIAIALEKKCFTVIYINFGCNRVDRVYFRFLKFIWFGCKKKSKSKLYYNSYSGASSGVEFTVWKNSESTL